MNHPSNQSEATNPPIPWRTLILLGIAVWLVFGAVPLFVDWLGVIDGGKLPRLGTIGDMFGAANALFSGFAFIAVAITLRQQQYSLFLQHRELELTRRELKESADAQQEIARLQSRAISLQVVLPLMD